MIRLKNGIKVLSLPQTSQFVSLAVCVRAGSRFENNGASQFMPNLAFKNSQAQIASMGGNLQAHATREAIIYQGSMVIDHVPSAMQMIADSINLKNFNHELEDAKNNILFGIRESLKKPQSYIKHHVNATAFNNIGLGNIAQTNPQIISNFQSQNILDFQKKFFTSDRIVVVGAGLETDKLAELANLHFGHLKSSNYEQETPKYTGGTSITKINPPPRIHTEEDPILTHIQIMFPAASLTEWHRWVPTTVLKFMMGGGDSFSAGGPGKGMFSRLYTQVLNRYGHIESCKALYDAYSDFGLFGISASCDPRFNSKVFSLVLQQLANMKRSISLEELERAKNQARSSLLMTMESQQSRVENVALQMLLLDSKIEPKTIAEWISQVQLADLVNTIDEILMCKPTCVAVSENIKDLE